MQNTPITKPNKTIKYNITLAERKAIKTLADDTNIIIKEADKGGTVVIMKKDYYKNVVNDMLSYENYYETLDYDPRKKDKMIYNKFLKKHKQVLTSKELDYLSNFGVKFSNFYGLPKIHKNKQIQQACSENDSMYIQISNVADLKLRPIVAGPACQTHRLSNLIDILLRPYTKRVQT